MADRFFTREPIAPGDFTLRGPEAHHLHAVRRIGVGESIVLFNGDGREYPAEVIEAGKKAIQLAVGEPVAVDRERTVPLWIASAIPKGDRLDFLIEKLTELGATRFVPLIAEFSSVRPKGDVVEKYERIVIEASKQCGRNVLMAVEPPTDWSHFAKREDLPIRKRILQPGANGGLDANREPTVVAIGPEGGFSDGELAMPGWELRSLGRTVLRIETAALAAVCAYNF